jgi:hypothetical protein
MKKSVAYVLLLDVRQNYLQGGFLACSSPAVCTDRLAAKPCLVVVHVKPVTKDPSFRNADVVFCM